MRNSLKEFLFFFLIFYVKGALAIDLNNGLKWVKVKIPQYKRTGETIFLDCEYDLGNDTLYSLKWYKDNEEFFRFIPKYHQLLSFEVDGININISKSSYKNLILNNVNWKSSGIYRCEVSGEAPSFISAQSDARMEIISLPETNPVITGIEAQYSIGNEININCTSAKSRPVSNLVWYINEEKIQKPENLVEYPIKRYPEGLMASTLGLRFNLSHYHFMEGSLKIKCLSTTIQSSRFNDYNDEAAVAENLLMISDLKEALLLVKNSAHRIINKTGNASDSIVVLIVLLIFFNSLIN